MNKYIYNEIHKKERIKMTLQVRGGEERDIFHSNLKLSLISWPEKMKKYFTDGGKAIPFHHFLGLGWFTQTFGSSRSQSS